MSRQSILQRSRQRSRFEKTLPSMICFRVTRYCNARCGFCLAPPDGGIHPPFSILKHRIDWLFAKGVSTIHFCGGEPTIHHDLADLIKYVHVRNKKSKLTTNGISISDKLINTLRQCKTEVKVSVHGPTLHHDEIVGCEAFDKTTETIRRLISAGVSTSIQTTIVTGHLDIVNWMIGFCADNKIQRVSFLPFIPRGNGFETRGKYELSPNERRNLQNLVKEKRRQLRSRIDIRMLDFNSNPIHVCESDGRVILESAMESMDQLLYVIAAEETASLRSQ